MTDAPRELPVAFAPEAHLPAERRLLVDGAGVTLETGLGFRHVLAWTGCDAVLVWSDRAELLLNDEVGVVIRVSDWHRGRDALAAILQRAPAALLAAMPDNPGTGTRAVHACIAILGGRDVDDAFLLVIGGPGARAVLGGRAGGPAGYWPRTWAARALLCAWRAGATPTVLAAAADPSWRVREMAARVIARHRLDDGHDVVEALLTDPVPRVRAAATRPGGG